MSFIKLIFLAAVFISGTSSAQTYIQGPNLIEVPATTATAAGTTTLTASSKKIQEFTGATTQTVVLPDATTLQVGRSFYITNRSTGIVTVNFNGGSLAKSLGPSTQVYLLLVSNGSAAGTWDVSSSLSVAAFGSTPNAVGLSLSGYGINLQPADATHPGGISIADWNTFNNKQSALTFGNLTDAGTDGIVVTSGTGAVIGSGTSFAQTKADATHNGYLSQTDWSTFNGKQASGNYITALTGDVTASGPGSVASTLATVNSNVGSFGSSTSIPSFTVNGKGLVTAASGNAVIAPAGTLSGTTLNSTVVSSSLTSVGTIATGVWNGTTIAIANGGTGQTSKAPAFDALSPMTTSGDIIYGGASGTGTRLAKGSDGNVLTLASGVPSWAAPAGGSALTVVSKSANYTLTTSDNIVLASGAAFTLTLPTAVGNTRTYYLKKTDSSLANAVSINTTSGETIGGYSSGTLKLASLGDAYQIYSDGSNWQILSHTYDESWSSCATISITATSVNPTKGTTGNDCVVWRRIGRFAEIRYVINITATGSGANGTGDYLFGNPTGLVADTTVVNIATSGGTIATQGSFVIAYMPASGQLSATNGTHQGFVVAALLYDTTHFRLTIIYDFATSSNVDPTHIPITGVGTGYAFSVMEPVQGFTP